MEQQTVVMIVGAGPAGIATSACLNLLSVPNVVLEREDCYASLWKKRSYDRLKLHLAKNFCQLPHMSFPSSAPTFVPKDGFIQYLDDYVSKFNVQPLYNKKVESASFDTDIQKWCVVSRNLVSSEVEKYIGRFLVVATGENSEGFIPIFEGLESFGGEILHSSRYENGKAFANKDVLVVGSGNSGMEITYDLFFHGARASVVVRSPVHVLTKEMVQIGMNLLKFLPCYLVDSFILSLSKLKHGDLSAYGLPRPEHGPFYLKRVSGRSPIIDVGTLDQIKKGEVKVLPSVTKVQGSFVQFENGTLKRFDAIVFATGYRSTTRNWLKDDAGDLFDGNGMPKRKPPFHWKGVNGLYCAGFARAGLFGSSRDATNIAADIKKVLSAMNNG